MTKVGFDDLVRYDDIQAIPLDIAQTPGITQQKVAGDSTIRRTIGGWNIGDREFKAGSGASTAGMNAQLDQIWRFFAGSDTPATAPFRVDEAGNVFMTSATIAGVLSATQGTFGGDGSDGALTVSADTVLNPTFKTFNYSSLTIDSGFTLSFGANFQNKVIRIKISGDCTINATLSLKGAGSIGGAGGSISGGAQGAKGNGSDGAAANTDILDSLSHKGKGGGVSTTGGAALDKTGIGSIYATQNKSIVYIIPSTAGAGGQTGAGFSGNTVSGGAGGTITALPTAGANGTSLNQDSGGGGGGGAGGGALILEVAGNLTIGASGVIDLSGQNGANGGIGTDGSASLFLASGGGGAGSGGAGGMGIILYNGTLSNSGSILIKGGNGGVGGQGGKDGSGGTQAGGDSASGAGFSSGVGGAGKAGGAVSTAGTSGAAGASGSGGSGAGGNTGSSLPGGTAGTGSSNSGMYILEKNFNFA